MERNYLKKEILMVKKSVFCFICLFFAFTVCGCSTAKKEQPKLSLKQTIKETGYRVTVYFDVSSSDLTLLSKDALMRAAKLQGVSETNAYLTGYADKTGDSEKNLILSKARVENAKDFIVSLGVKENNIHIDFKGDENPVDDTDTPEAYSKNRRVEVLLTAAGALASN
jgi:outer membrane protein OmpA-like peptidoglycan-associated protein